MVAKRFTANLPRKISVHCHMVSGGLEALKRSAYDATSQNKIFTYGRFYIRHGCLLETLCGVGCVDRGEYWAEMHVGCHTTGSEKSCCGLTSLGSGNTTTLSQPGQLHSRGIALGAMMWGNLASSLVMKKNGVK